MFRYNLGVAFYQKELNPGVHGQSYQSHDIRPEVFLSVMFPVHVIVFIQRSRLLGIIYFDETGSIRLSSSFFVDYSAKQVIRILTIKRQQLQSQDFFFLLKSSSVLDCHFLPGWFI
jgi:hypothetical protein